MAWTETCKIDANKQVDHLAKKGMSITGAIKKLSAESGIPPGTIQRWVYPRNEGKNDPTPTTNQNDEKKGAGQGNDDAGQKWPTCSQCEYKAVEKNYQSGKPNSNGLCRSCRRKNADKKKVEKAREIFDQIPIDQEADLFWKEIAESLNNVADNIGEENFKKISRETLDLLCEPISRFNRICDKLALNSEYIQM